MERGKMEKKNFPHREVVRMKICYKRGNDISLQHYFEVENLKLYIFLSGGNY